MPHNPILPLPSPHAPESSTCPDLQKERAEHISAPILAPRPTPRWAPISSSQSHRKIPLNQRKLKYPVVRLFTPRIILNRSFQVHTSTKAPQFPRLNSNQRVPSKEQIPLPPKRPQQKPANGKSKPGFTIASPSEHDDDDDEWISSESGAATPNHQHSTSDTSSETYEERPMIDSDITDQQGLTRVDTVKPFNFEPPRRDHSTPKPVTPPPAQRLPQYQQPMIHRCPTLLSESELTKESTTAPISRHSPRPSSKRYSRPPSTHSISSRAEHLLRPHPLIRGQSYGHVNVILPKPAPLAPLTFIPNAAMSHSSPTNTSSHESASNSSGHPQQQIYLSSSPTSMKTSSPTLPDLTTSYRRTSFSSTGSINTIPIHSSSSLTLQSPHPASVYRSHDRARTLSSSSSSAALSSLTHLPYVLSHTRPPSPNPHTILFFPPVNQQHVNAMEGIHPLLPAPYLSNHMTVLARRTPIRESFDRVIRARSGR